MKRLALALMMSTLTACGAANSNDTSAVKDVSTNQDAVTIPVLPILVLPQIIVKPAPNFAAVQPTAMLKFSYSSCSGRTWSLKRETTNLLEGKVTYLQVEDKKLIDCAGPVIARDYSVQISSDTMADGRYVLINPSVVAFSTNK